LGSCKSVEIPLHKNPRAHKYSGVKFELKQHDQLYKFSHNDKSYVVANYATVSDNTQLVRMAEYFIADSNSEYAGKVIELITDENVKNELLKKVK